MKNILFVMLFAMLFLVPTVSALDFFPTHDYDEASKTATIYSDFLKLQKVADIQLISNTEYCLTTCEAVLKITPNKDIELNDDLDYKFLFKDITKTKDMSKRILGFETYKKTGTETYLSYEQTGETCGSALGNGSRSCVPTFSNIQRTRDKWEKFQLTPSLFKKLDGSIEIKIVGKKLSHDTVDWMPVFYGRTISEMAVWQSSFEVGLQYYFNMTTGNEQIAGVHNLVADEGVATYTTTNALLGSSASVTTNQNLKDTAGANDKTFQWQWAEETMNVWIRRTSALSTGDAWMGDYQGGEVGYYWTYGSDNTITLNYVSTNPSYAVGNRDGQWMMITVMKNASTVNTYINGTFVGSVASTSGGYDDTTNKPFHIGCEGLDPCSNEFNGLIDEMSWYNRSLSQAEITDFYNSGLGLTRTSIVSTLISPANATKTTNPSQTFVCNVTAIATTINNATLYIWNATGTGIVYQNTTGISGTQNLTNWTFSLPVDNNYLWNCQACDSDGDCGFASENRTLSIDTAPPTINVLYPSATIPIAYLGENISLNYSIIDTDIASCWVEYNGTNSSIPCSTNTTMILDTQKTLKIWANDSVGNINYTQADWDYGSFINSETHDNDVYETEESTFILNDTYDTSNYVSISAALVYNGVSYDASKSGTGQNILFTKAINAPLVTADTNKTFYWNITLVNNSNSVSYHVSQNYTQLVRNANDIYIGSCGSNITAFKFDFSDEVSIIPVPLVNVSYSINYGLSTGNIGTIYGNLPNINNFTICIPNSSTYYLGGEINYLAGGYSNRRYYIFDNTKSIEPTTNITAYLLDSTSSKDFNINVYDNYQNPYAFYYVSLIKWFPSLNEYKIVEMSKTNEVGKTLVSTKLSDTDYRIGVYSINGSLIKMTNPLKMICLISPCEYNIYVSEADKDYTSEYGIESSLTFNSSLNRFLFIWNDPSQKTQSMTLKITKQGLSTDLILCEESSSGYTGAIVCDVGNQTGTLKAAAYRTASPLKMINSIIVTLGNGLNIIAGGTWGLFLGVISVMLVALIGVFSPIASIVLAVVVLIPLVLLGAINWMILVGIAVIGGAIIHILRRT